MRPPRLAVLALIAIALGGTSADAADSSLLRPGETILFVGDSITQAGDYIVDVEAYLATRFPNSTFTILNHGLSSETASGTSEPDHSPRRPCIHDRFDADVAAWSPDVVVICYGMNDGNYFPYLDADRFDRYRAGIRRLIDRVRDRTKARVVLLTPPPFDAGRRRVADPAAREFGYKNPASDYDRTLAHYADWLRTLEPSVLAVGDVHAASVAALKLRRVTEPGFFLAGDAVHPGPTGHWLIAQTFLEAIHAPEIVSVVDVDARQLSIRSGAARAVSRDRETLKFEWTTPLPMPIPPGCDAAVMASERVSERINRQRLMVRGLAPGRHRVTARWADGPGEAAVFEATHRELASGLDVTSIAEFPSTRRASEVYALVAARRRAIDDDWRAHRQVKPAGELAALAEIRELCRPHSIAIAIDPIVAGTGTVPRSP